jgi:polysaccharide deacetylase 2 family uncharacterized protein YibQ
LSADAYLPLRRESDPLLRSRWLLRAKMAVGAVAIGVLASSLTYIWIATGSRRPHVTTAAVAAPSFGALAPARREVPSPPSVTEYYRPSMAAPFHWPATTPRPRDFDGRRSTAGDNPSATEAALGRAESSKAEPPRPRSADRRLQSASLPTVAAPTLKPPLAPGWSNERLPWLAHAVPHEPRDRRPEIALIIDDAGADVHRTARAMALPGPLTIAFLPFARELQRQADNARDLGHELILHMPMETIGGMQDPEPYMLRPDLPAETLRLRLRRQLDSFSGYVGASNHMGSRFTASIEAMGVVAAELARRGLLFIDSRTSGSSIAHEVAEAHGMPALKRDVFLDHVDSRTAIRQQMAEAESVSRRQGFAVVIGHPRDNTLAELEAWLPYVQHQGFRLVPVSHLARHRHLQVGSAAKPVE